MEVSRDDLLKSAMHTAMRDAAEVPAKYVGEVFEQQLQDLARISKISAGPRKVLLLGGGGYVGTVVAGHLLDTGYSVRCLDPFVYGHEHAIGHLLNCSAFEYQNGDMGDTSALDRALDGVTDVAILGGLVGDPITKSFPGPSAAINEDSITSVVSHLAGRDHLRRVIFVYTCSNYGLVPDDALANETTQLSPLSLYAKAKVEMEKLVLSQKGKTAFEATVLRFATAFGLSPRMRFDLTVSQFAREMALGRDLVVFDPDTWRPYCHVCDFARLIRRVIEAPSHRIDYQVFNAGGDVNNSTKRSLVETIRKYVPDATITIQQHGSDPRNYRVDFSKLVNQLYFVPQWSIDDGVRQVVNAVREGLYAGPDENFGNFSLKSPWDRAGE